MTDPGPLMDAVSEDPGNLEACRIRESKDYLRLRARMFDKGYMPTHQNDSRFSDDVLNLIAADRARIAELERSAIQVGQMYDKAIAERDTLRERVKGLETVALNFLAVADERNDLRDDLAEAVKWIKILFHDPLAQHSPTTKKEVLALIAKHGDFCQ